MKIMLIFRAKDPVFYSIENVFGAISKVLMSSVRLGSFVLDNRGFNFANLLSLRKLVASQTKDTIYHMTGDVHYTVFALPRKRTLLTIHDCVFVNSSKGIKRWLIKKLYLDWPVKFAPMVVTISEKTKDEVVALTGCKPEKIRVINNPVSPYLYYSRKKFNARKPRLLFIGTLPNKNLNRTIEALKDLPCVLNIIGTPGEHYQKKLNDFNIEHVIERNLSDQQMALRYEQADIILFPSLYEGFGLPIIEGFKAGRAVLTSDISPLKEVSGGAAWLVDPFSALSIRSAIHNIVTDEETRNRKIQEGFKIVEQYSPARIASEYLQAYSDLNMNRANVSTSAEPSLQ